MAAKARLGLGLATAAALLMAAVLVIPVWAAPGAQGSILPTPTWYPVEQITYELERVGGEAITFRHDFGEVNGFTVGEMTAVSQYPLGMIFTLNPVSPNGEIKDVILMLRYLNGSGNRVTASYDAAQGAWVAQMGSGATSRVPAWMYFDLSWRIRDVAGNTVDTAQIPLHYWDPNRQWWRMENDYSIVYWWGFAEDNPDLFAREATELLAGTHPRRVAGFNGTISYKPSAVIYGTRAAWDEAQITVSNSSAGGSTSQQWGITEQYVPDYQSDKDVRASRWLSHTIAHELVHLWQYDLLAATGPNWWTEGQAEYFSSPYIEAPELSYDARLFNLAKMQDLPPLALGEVSRNLTMADGQMYYVYDAGTSFINWMIATYGMESHAKIAAQMAKGTPFYQAFEATFERPFVEVENEWRAYLGANLLNPADIDPASALQDYTDSMIAVGDEITLPAMPVLVSMKEAPGPNAIPGPQCFGGSKVKVLAMGALDEVPYFQIECMGMTGWVTREALVGQ